MKESTRKAIEALNLTHGGRAILAAIAERAEASPEALHAELARFYTPDALNGRGPYGRDVDNAARLVLQGLHEATEGVEDPWNQHQRGLQGVADSGVLDVGEGSEPDDPSYRRAREWIAAAEKKQADRKADSDSRIAAKMQARRQNEEEREQRGQIPGIPPPEV